MNIEPLISFLVQSNWVFLAGWILLLATAFAACFSDRPLRVQPQKRHSPDVHSMDAHSRG
jgi:hypothetical protein